ncbi:MAG: hypothetical protein DMF68_15840 [Acidobacteria bacterium]|nr:MAG: hypothetical protein DMF68_15840 [Acidobacteriota bacterium]
MTKLKIRIGALPLVALCLLVLGGAAALAQRQFRSATVAGARPEVKVTLSGAIERDQKLLPIEKAETVNPGETLDWIITSENDGNASAHDYKAVGQIPRGTVLVAGSTTADGSASVVYSIDNGKSFSSQPMIEEKQPDGSTKQVPAPVSMYTQLRYEWSDPLASGGRLQASYKVRVK